LRPWEIPAAVHALRNEKHAALRAIRERRATERFSNRMAQRNARAPPDARPS
jgi:hypothetical protein